MQLASRVSWESVKLTRSERVREDKIVSCVIFVQPSTILDKNLAQAHSA